VAEVDGRPVGTVRWDVRSGIGEVSIAVAREQRGQGRATAILRSLVEIARHDAQVVRLVAAVDPDNAASLRAFTASGFGPAGRRGEQVLLTWDPGSST
jgi:RimJ/RimL family protein N-acetyltransferase